jgi:hypothetical protein
MLSEITSENSFIEKEYTNEIHNLSSDLVKLGHKIHFQMKMNLMGQPNPYQP